MGIARRAFLLGTAVIAGGLGVGWYLYRKPHDNPLESVLAEGERTFNPFVKVGPDGTVTVIVPRAEMGQGVTTTLAALVAEEMDQPIDTLRVEHGPASAAYFNGALMEASVPFAHYEQGALANFVRAAARAGSKFLGMQITGGSTSTVDAFDRMRLAGAATRAVLIEAAASRLGHPAESLRCETRAVLHSESGTRIGFGELVDAAAALDVPGGLRLKPEAQWTQLGTSLARVDVPAKTRGEARFGIDVRLPDMLYGTIRMSPHFGAGMLGFDASGAVDRPGVLEVVDLGFGVGVIATDTWQAFAAAKAIEVEWDVPEPARSTAEIFSVIEAALDAESGDRHRDDGDVEGALAGASTIIEAEYRAPYLAHACMEPMNATARIADGRCEVWVGTQAPTLVRDVIASDLDIDAANVLVHTTLLGGGFGRRSEVDFPRYAVQLANTIPGRAVKVTWTREEDITHDTYRPGAIGRFRGVLGPDGLPSVVDADIAAQSVMRSMFARTLPDMKPMGPDATIVEGSHNQPYAVPNYRVTGHEVHIDLPVGFWRSVGNSFNGFFHETFLDELAAAAKRDPVQTRLELMAPWPAAAKVVERVAALADWSAPLSPPRGRGVAFTLSFGSYVAQIVEVTDTGHGIRIDKVYAVIDCGRALDRGNLEAQLQSGIVFGLSAAIGQEITFAAGAVEQTNFHDYDAMRIHQSPEIVVDILENSPVMGGAGEPGTPPSVPALGNAIFAATGVRLRALPFSKRVQFVG